MSVAITSTSFADDSDNLPNVEQFVADEGVGMGTLARTEQKLGYYGDIDDVRWKLYKCISLDVGAGVIRGGLDCETNVDTGGYTEVSEEYKKLQNLFYNTVCEQNQSWVVYMTSVTGDKATAGKVSCSALAEAYCSAADKDKAKANITTYYDCSRGGAKITCADLAESYCPLVGYTSNPSGDGDGAGEGIDTGDGSSSSTPKITEEEKAALIQKAKESEATKAISTSVKRKCVVDGVEVDCEDLAEANAIRKKTNKESTFNEDTTECYADIVCRNSEGSPVDCQRARDIIQCGKSSSEGLSVEYSCSVGGEAVDCLFLGVGECTPVVCDEMCPEYGGKVTDNTCECYTMPAVCTELCEYGAVLSDNVKSIATVEVTNSGSGYSEGGVLSKDDLGISYSLTRQSSTPKVSVTIYDEGGSGSGATGEAVYTVDNTSVSTTINVSKINVLKPGSGYTNPKATVTIKVGANSKSWGVALGITEFPQITVTDSSGSGAVLKAVLSNGKISAIQVVNGGNYYVDPQITITSNAGEGATAKVTKITDCVCNEKPDCAKQCDFDGVAVGNGTTKCECYTEPVCSSSSKCLYGGVPDAKLSDASYACTEATCPYGYLSDDFANKCDESICPYGVASGTIVYQNCADPNVCTYGGVSMNDGSCTCNTAPDCVQKCTYGGTPKANGTDSCSCNAAPVCSSLCTYGGTARADGTQSCACNNAPNCNDSSVCAYGGTAKANGTNACACNSAPNCNSASVCPYGGTAKANGTQECTCNSAPNCDTACTYGGTAKADGTQGCNCLTSAGISYSLYTTGGNQPSLILKLTGDSSKTVTVSGIVNYHVMQDAGDSASEFDFWQSVKTTVNAGSAVTLFTNVYGTVGWESYRRINGSSLTLTWGKFTKTISGTSASGSF